MSDVTDRPVTIAEFEAFERRFEQKLEAIREEFRVQLGTKPTMEQVESRLRPVESSVQQIITTTARIDGSLDALLKMTGARVDDLAKRVRDAETTLELNTSAVASAVSDLRLVQSHVFGDASGAPPGLFRNIEALTTALNDLPARNSESLRAALTPINTTIQTLQLMVERHEAFIETRRKIETVVLTTGQRVWGWFTKRSPATQGTIILAISFVIGLIVAPTQENQPFIEILRSLLMRWFG
jgi:hypothetical protein